MAALRENSVHFPYPLSLTVLTFEFLEIFLAAGVIVKKQNGDLREGPLEMGIADLLA
jgi:hypothetical protein